MRVIHLFYIGLIELSLSGCIQTQEMPLAPNVVRLDTHASGLLFTGQSVPQTMRRAAQLTLQAGYTRFRFADASSAQGSRLIGANSTTDAYGNTSGVVNGNGNSATFSGSTVASADTVATPIYQHTSDVGVTVIMLKAGDPGYDTAFDAQQVLSQYSK